MENVSDKQPRRPCNGKASVQKMVALEKNHETSAKTIGKYTSCCAKTGQSQNSNTLRAVDPKIYESEKTCNLQKLKRETGKRVNNYPDQRKIKPQVKQPCPKKIILSPATPSKNTDPSTSGGRLLLGRAPLAPLNVVLCRPLNFSTRANVKHKLASQLMIISTGIQLKERPSLDSKQDISRQKQCPSNLEKASEMAFWMP
jgi:hypothetical protein